MDCFTEGRWNIALDMDCDGTFGISDAWGWLLYVFFVPGDLVILAMMDMPLVTDLISINSTDYGGGVSVAVSALVWFIVLAFVATGTVIRKRT